MEEVITDNKIYMHYRFSQERLAYGGKNLWGDALQGGMGGGRSLEAFEDRRGLKYIFEIG